MIERIEFESSGTQRCKSKENYRTKFVRFGNIDFGLIMNLIAEAQHTRVCNESLNFV